LQDLTIAKYFKHYFEIAKWYDLSDHKAVFGTKIPEIALSNPLLFSAIIALAAIHLSRTSLPTARNAAEHYHACCVTDLIQLDRDDEVIDTGVPLAATCLLRSYEILAGKLSIGASCYSPSWCGPHPVRPCSSAHQ